MPIAKLNDATARLIGSSVAITSPEAVVKELLDNAIDAGADSVEISISPNTLDCVRARDNGRGVSVDDLDSLGRPSHTSKLSTCADLNTGRVHTLGFRGQALASINNIATVQVVTKTEQEPVAVKVQLDAQGGGIGIRFPPVSAPTGTTVLVNDMFGSMPPRRQMLLKESKKVMARIRELLTAYTLAHADVRISLKVMGEEKQSARFGQTRDRDMKQSILEVFGAAAAKSGETHRFAVAESPTSTVTLLAFLPNISCDDKAVKGKGAFISVNRRPVSAAIGIGKALTGVFRTKWQQGRQRAGLGSVPQTLLSLAISCSFASYDANVATMKDDVLFANAEVVLRAFEDLCSSVYDKPAADTKAGRLSKTMTGATNEKNTGIEDVENLVSVQMRVMSRVNMIRADSDASDEEAEDETVEVLIPQKITNTPAENETSTQGTAKESPPKLLRGIQRYFQPSEPDFEIATDDTATPELTPAATVPSIEANETAAPAPNRMPLSAVSDTTLNRLAGPQDSGSDSSSQGDVDAPRLSDLNGTSWSIQSLLSRNALQLPSPSRGIDVAITNTPASPPPQRQRESPNPLIRGRQIEQRRRVDGATSLMTLGTPPPIDLVRSNEYSLSPAGFVEVNRRRQLSPASSGSSDGEAVEELQVVQRRVAAPARGFSSARVIMEQSVPVSSRLPRQGKLVDGTQTRRTGGFERLLARRRAEHEGLHRETANPRESLGPNSPGTLSVRSRGFQLPQTPFVRGEADRNVADAASMPPPKRHCMADRGTSRPQALPKFQSPLPRNARNQEKLFLEHIPPSMATGCSVAVATVDMTDIRISMAACRDLDLYIRTGELEYGLSNITRTEADRLQTRMQRLCPGPVW